VELKNEFTVNAPVEQAWPLLLDVASIADCVPGGELVEKVDDRSFKGRVSVKLGPVLLTFEGDANLVETNEGDRRVRVKARGTDKKGRGTAQANVVMQLAPQGTASTVSIVTDLQLAGTVAQYGRATGLIAEVSRQLVGEFAANVNRRIETLAPSPEIAPVAAQQLGAKPISAGRLALRVLSAWMARLFGAATGNV
jgi:uncharacterized protein